MVIKYIFAWIGLMAIGIANGIVRESLYSKYFTELRAHQFSSFTGIVLMGVYVWMLSKKWPLFEMKEAIIIGFIWFAMTVSFEFLFGYYVAKHTLSELLFDYNVFKGRLWPIVLLWVVISPLIFFKLSK